MSAAPNAGRARPSPMQGVHAADVKARLRRLVPPLAPHELLTPEEREASRQHRQRRDDVHQLDLLRDKASHAALAWVVLVKQSQLHPLGSRTHQRLRREALAMRKTAVHYARLLMERVARRVA